jgi:hypothetical protein
MGHSRAIHYATALALIASPASARDLTADNIAKATAASPFEISLGAKVDNDPLEQEVVVSTSPFFSDSQRAGDVVASDRFVRAFINKKTGEARFQIYVWIEYVGDWQLFSRASYSTPSGPQSVDVTEIGTNVIGCRRASCLHREDVGFIVPEADLRAISAGASGGSGQTWAFKLTGRFEGGTRLEMLITEIAGALIAVDRERQYLK